MFKFSIINIKNFIAKFQIREHFIAVFWFNDGTLYKTINKKERGAE
jgi:hypothetical protein